MSEKTFMGEDFLAKTRSDVVRATQLTSSVNEEPETGATQYASKKTAHIPYLICAGEPSGDLLAAELVTALHEAAPWLEPYGVTGEAMRQAGVNSIGDCQIISVMGFVEVAKRIAKIKMFKTEVLNRIDKLSPKFAILVDSPGFHFVLAEQLHLRGIKVIEYVAPQLWAWGQKRTGKLNKIFDLILGVMPFEEEFFSARGVKNFVYVGTPQIDRVLKAKHSDEKFGLTDNAPVFAFFPGSRITEFKKIMPIIIGVSYAIKSQMPNCHFLVSIACSLPQNVESGLVAKHSHLRFIRGSSLDLMRIANTALVTSGTATLECALSKTPLAVMYKMNPISYLVAKKLVKVPYISLVNFVAGKKLVTEFIQKFSVQDVANELISLSSDRARREKMIDELEALIKKVKASTAQNAANAVLDFVRKENLDL